MKILVPRSPQNNKQNLHQGCRNVTQIMKEICAKVVEFTKQPSVLFPHINKNAHLYKKEEQVPRLQSQ
jgi:hypothetical protein